MLRCPQTSTSALRLNMNLKRTATIGAVGGALVAWLASAATSNRPIPPPIVIRTPPIDLRGAELADEVARLHERLRPTTTPNQPGRNLFSFRAARARAAAADLAAPPSVPSAITEAPLPRPALP